MEKIQYISQGDTLEEQERNIVRVLENGCRWIQLRWKNVSEEEFVELANSVKNLCKKYGAVFIINDHVDVAKRVDADGVHLGLTDMAVAQAKEILGENKIIGGTANTIEDVIQRCQEGCTYIGVGPFRFTTTKEKLSPLLGVEGYGRIVTDIAQKEGFPIPIFAIGGIEEGDLEALKNTGVYGVALSGLLTRSPARISKIKELL